MPIYFDQREFLNDDHSFANLMSRSRSVAHEEARKVVNIGLVNNAKDKAFLAVERQFLSLLASASDGISVRVQLFNLRGIPRANSVLHHIRKYYSTFEPHAPQILDGLIVTGREPSCAHLSDEPYWPDLTEAIEWAQLHTISAIWSCLAAHAAVLCMDNIHREKRQYKCSGVFECRKLSHHPIVGGTKDSVTIPHSRWNSLEPASLTRSGYKVLTGGESTGVDTFIRENGSLFVFFQGHPEYEQNTLLLEYRRDIKRYQEGDLDDYPTIPTGYFDASTFESLRSIELDARSCSRRNVLGEISSLLRNARTAHIWREPATCIYSNWLRYIAERK